MTKILCSTLAIALVLAITAPAQIFSGSLTGSVTDPSGNVVPRAAIRLTNELNGEERIGATNETGDFVFAALVPGTYTIRVEAPGFRLLERKGNVVVAAGRLSVGALQLELGSVTESVTVTAQGAGVETATSSNSSLLNTKQIQMISLRGRDPIVMLRILPGAAQGGLGNLSVDADLFGGSFATVVPSIQGGTGQQVYVDGVNGGDGGGGGRFSGATNMDAIAEVNVQLSNYKAEYGRSGGSQINFITKRGGSEYHGTGYWYKRHEMFNATNFFNNLYGIPKQIYRYRNLGGNIGGPVKLKIPILNPDGNKMFFFYSVDDTQVRDSSLSPTAEESGQVSSTVERWTMPTALERQGDFSQSVDLNGRLIPVRDPLNNNQPFANNRIPSTRANPLGIAIMNIFPLPNFNGAGHNYVFQEPATGKPRRQHLFRFDLRPTNKDTISVKRQTWFTKSAGIQVAANSSSWGLVKQRYDFTVDQGTVEYTRIISPRLVNEFMIGVFYSTEYGPPVDEEALRGIQRQYRGLSGLGQFAPRNNPLNIIPKATFGGIPTSYVAASIYYDNRMPLTGADTALTSSNNLTYTRGSHTFKMGAWWEMARFGQARASLFAGSFDFGNDTNDPLNLGYAFANAYAGHFRQYTESLGRAPDNRRQHTIAWFVQDTWKLHRRLTVDIGLRLYKWGYPIWGGGEASAFTFERFDPTWGGKPPVYFRPILTAQGRGGENPLTGAILPVAYIGAMVPGTGYACNDPITPTTPCKVNGVVIQENGNYVKSGRGFYEQRSLLFDPRLGLAWDVFGDGKMAIRTSFGVFHQATGGSTFKGGPAFGFNKDILFSDLNSLLTAASVTTPTDATGPWRLGQKQPLNYQYMFGIQKDVGWNTVLDVSYVGRSYHHNIQSWNFNAVPAGARFLPQNQDPTAPGRPLPDPFLRPIRGFGNISISGPATTARYDSLQVQVNRRFIRGVELAGNYTYAGGTSNGWFQNNPLPSIVARSRNTNIQTHVVNVSYVVDLPAGSKLIPGRATKWALDDWQVSGFTSFASGFPLNVSFSTTDSFDFAGGGESCGVVQTGSALLAHGERTFDRWFNTSAFQRPSGRGDIGNNCYNYKFRGPGFNNWDMSLFKNFPVREKKAFQFRWEFYNFFNHTQFKTVNNTARFDPQGRQVNADFGKITGARPERRMQASLRFNF